jgi:hypothetical protein
MTDDRHQHRHHHSDPPTPPEGFRAQTALRLRFWIGGRLRDEIWLDAADSGAGDLAQFCATYHTELAEMADAAGIPWMTEVYDPGQPEDRAYLRIGTDLDGMHDPRPLNGSGPGR